MLLFRLLIPCLLFDWQVILHLIAISKKRPFVARLVDACEQLEGAYSLVFLSEEKVVAVRDPHGFRPLVMGRKSNGAYVFASETCALDLIEAEYTREVNKWFGRSPSFLNLQY